MPKVKQHSAAEKLAVLHELEIAQALIMGSHGHGPVMTMLGSVSQRALSNAACPVLIVK